MSRAFIVIALALVVLGLTVPNVWYGQLITGNTPLSIDSHYDIVSITPGLVADKTGLRIGDHIEPQSLSTAGRLAMQTGVWYGWRPGESIKFTAYRAGHPFVVEFREPVAGPTNGKVAILKRTTATIFIVVAAVLLLLRPSTMLWGLFLYALGSANASPLVLDFVNPMAATIGTTLLVSIVYTFLGPLGLVIFATRFPAESTFGLRRRIENMTPILAALLAVPSVAFVLYVVGIALPKGTDVVTNGIVTGIITIGIIALIAGFVQLDAAQRQRLRWVVAGVALFYAAALYETVSPYLPAQGWPPAWTNSGWSSDVLNGFVVFIPISVAYAAFKHHVLDLNFVIGRGLVYGILTSIAVATLAIVEWFLSGGLAQTKLATVGEIVAAIAIGFWIKNLHNQVDRFVDAIIFRHRHLAEQRLVRVAAGLPHADKLETVSEMVAAEPVNALGLVSSAFFRRRDDREFHCELAIGLSRDALTMIGVDDQLAVHLQGQRGAVFLHQIGWKMPGAIESASALVVACPIFVRHELEGIVLYGGHKTGEAIDPDEMRSIEALCIGASAAIDHLEAAALAARLEETQRALALSRKDAETLRSALAASGS